MSVKQAVLVLYGRTMTIIRKQETYLLQVGSFNYDNTKMVYNTYFLPQLPNSTDPILDYDVSTLIHIVLGFIQIQSSCNFGVSISQNIISLRFFDREQRREVLEVCFCFLLLRFSHFTFSCKHFRKNHHFQGLKVSKVLYRFPKVSKIF